MSRKLLFEWPDLEVRVTALLADDKNPELCQEVWDALPFKTIQAHAVVSGGSMYSWVPMLSFAEIPVKERIDEAPIGRVRYTQGTGNKISIQYGPCTEDVMGAVLGEVVPEDLAKVKAVGHLAWESTFFTKKVLPVRISRLEDAGPRAVGAERQKTNVSASGRTFIEAVRAEADKLHAAEPEELKGVRLGRNRLAGSYGQYFSAWDFVYGQLRDYSAYTLYPLAKLARNPAADVKQLALMYREITPTYTNFLGFCGLRTMQRFAGELAELAKPERLSKEDFVACLDAFCKYTNLLTSWAYFYFPWGLGVMFRFPDDS